MQVSVHSSGADCFSRISGWWEIGWKVIPYLRLTDYKGIKLFYLLFFSQSINSLPVPYHHKCSWCVQTHRICCWRFAPWWVTSALLLCVLHLTMAPLLLGCRCCFLPGLLLCTTFQWGLWKLLVFHSWQMNIISGFWAFPRGLPNLLVIPRDEEGAPADQQLSWARTDMGMHWESGWCLGS